jgi:glutathionylspermidine synthase
LLGREGANITLHGMGADLETGGDYGDEGFIYQQCVPLRQFQGRFPIIGSWVIGEKEGAAAGGIGIRESESPIITNTSRFVPHLFL